MRDNDPLPDSDPDNERDNHGQEPAPHVRNPKPYTEIIAEVVGVVLLGLLVYWIVF